MIWTNISGGRVGTSRHVAGGKIKKKKFFILNLRNEILKLIFEQNRWELFSCNIEAGRGCDCANAATDARH